MRSLFVVLLVACGGQTTTDPRMDAATYPDSSPVVDATVMLKDASMTPDAGPADFCPMNATFDIAVTGNGKMFEGKLVRLAAIENDQMTMKQFRRVLVSGTVKNGVLSLSCAKSLNASNYYPSWAVFVDADGDGKCSSGDFAVQQQLFGWMMNIASTIQGTDWVSVTSLKPPIGGMAPDFCSGYFE